MPKDLTAGVAYAPEHHPDRAARRRMSGVELFTIGALMLSTMVAATVVSIGIARADVIDTLAAPETPIAFLLVTGLILAAMVGLTAFATRRRAPRP